MRIDKATASRLFHHRLGIPKTWKNAIFKSKEDKTVKENFCSIIRKVVSQNNEHGLLEALCLSVQSDSDIGTAEKGVFSMYLSNENFSDAVWDSFIRCCSVTNRPSSRKMMKGGKPRRESWESFYFLSDEEKGARASFLLNRIIYSDALLSNKDFKEMKEILFYTDKSFSEKEKAIVCRRFMRNWKVREGLCLYEDFLAELECGCDEYGTIVSAKFAGWEKAADEAAAQKEINGLLALLRRSIRSHSYWDFDDRIRSLSKGRN